MALDTVQDYINAARILLQDQVDSPYRYSDNDLVEALNEGILETCRLRPDIIMAMGWNFVAEPPSFTQDNESATVPLPPAYRKSFVYYIIGTAQLRDEENTQDARATVFINKFMSQLTVIQS